MENKNSLTGKGLFPPKYAFTLLIPLRNIFLSPKKLIKQMKLNPDHIVLEIGPGPGYFSSKVASFLKNGKLYLFDIQKDMLEKAKKRIDRKKIKNVLYFHADGKSLPFENNHFDRIFMVTVLGEVENKNDYIQEIYRVLKRNGTIAISEQAGDPDKMTLLQIDKLMTNNNMTLCDKFGKENNFTVIYIKQ